MTGALLSSGGNSLEVAAKTYFDNVYQKPGIVLGAEIDKSLSWIPTLHFRVHEHLTVIAEVSETPYPLIFNLRRTDIIKMQMPISIYCVCPEESYLANQSDAKRLMNDGYGLLTVSADGTVQRRATCIPIIQQITDEEFFSEIKNMPRKIRSLLAESFERYKHSAPSGAAHIAEIIEGLVLRAARDAAGKGWISAKDAKAGTSAKILSAMINASQLHNAIAAIGGTQAYISKYRNPSHHFPKDKRQAAAKYRDCRHGFLEGLKTINYFREHMKNCGLSGLV